MVRAVGHVSCVSQLVAITSEILQLKGAPVHSPEGHPSVWKANIDCGGLRQLPATSELDSSQMRH